MIKSYRAFIPKLGKAIPSFPKDKFGKHERFNLILVDDNLWFNQTKMEFSVKVRIETQEKIPNGTRLILLEKSQDKLPGMPGIYFSNDSVWVRNDKNELCIDMNIDQKCQQSCSEDIVQYLRVTYPSNDLYPRKPHIE